MSGKGLKVSALAFVCQSQFHPLSSRTSLALQTHLKLLLFHVQLLFTLLTLLLYILWGNSLLDTL